MRSGHSGRLRWRWVKWFGGNIKATAGSSGTAGGGVLLEAAGDTNAGGTVSLSGGSVVRIVAVLLIYRDEQLGTGEVVIASAAGSCLKEREYDSKNGGRFLCFRF